jgi:uncharacterized protein (TIRG00374 family)
MIVSYTQKKKLMFMYIGDSIVYDPQPARLFHRHPFRRIRLHVLMYDHKHDESREKEGQLRSLPEQSAPLPPALRPQGHPVPGDLLAEPDHVALPQLSTPRNAHNAASISTRSGWKSLLGHPAVKLTVGLVVGIGLLLFIANLVNLPEALHIIQSQLGTPRGLFSGLMASVTFFMAFIFRALRWKLFLQRVGKIKTLRVIQLFMVGVFLNFLVPIRIGEVAKSLILKRVANMPIGQSLSTITIDKVFDLLPALFIVALVPLFHVSLDGQFWVVLSLANGALLGMVLFVLLSAWKRSLAFSILHSLLKPFPSSLGDKVEGFATGFVETLLASARQPLLFFSATGITVVAVCFDGLYNYFSFWTIGYPISFGQAVLGYMLFNIFYILPSPPGQVGSNEIVGLLIFHGLLHIPAENVLAVIGLFHIWSGILMCTSGIFNLSSLGITFSNALKLSTGGNVATQVSGHDSFLQHDR